MTRRRLWVIAFAVGLLAPADLVAQGSVAYRALDLGVLQQDTGAHVRGLNNAGALAGGGGSRLVAFMLTGSAQEIIPGLPGADWSVALGLNDDGVVVGASNTATALRGFIWSRADVVGRSRGPTRSQAVRWTRSGGIRALGTLPGAPTVSPTA